MNSRTRRPIFNELYQQSKYTMEVDSISSMTQDDQYLYNNQGKLREDANIQKGIIEQASLFYQNNHQEQKQQDQHQLHTQANYQGLYTFQSQINPSFKSFSQFTPLLNSVSHLCLPQIIHTLSTLTKQSKSSYQKQYIQNLLQKIIRLNQSSKSNKLTLKDIIMIDKGLLERNIQVERQQEFKMKVWINKGQVNKNMQNINTDKNINNNQ